MIESIHATNFKGLTFDQPIGEKNLIIGRNGSGKSARSQALQLCLAGYVPSPDKPKKQNAEIMESFASSDSMIVGVTASGVKYERRFFRTRSGQVSQKYRINGGSWNVTKFEFDVAISKVPMPLDLSVFISLSDQKKIDHLFRLYPPKAGIADLNSQIEKAEEKLKAKQMVMRDTEALIASLEKKVAETKLPAGSLEEIRTEIDRTTKESRDTIKNIERAKAEAAESERTARAEAERMAKKPIDKENNQSTTEQKATADNNYRRKPTGNLAYNAPPPGYDLAGNKKEERPKLSDFAGMSPLAGRVANEIRGLARESITDMITVAEKVNAQAVALKGKVHLKRFAPVEVQDIEQF